MFYSIPAVLAALFAIVMFLIKIARFTGAWISIVFLYLVEEVIMIKLLKQDIALLASESPTVYGIYNKSILIIALLIVLYFTSRNILRIILGNPDFGYIKLLLKLRKRRKKEINISGMDDMF